ncbi:hypothetical protein CIPAW_09G189300 [Carya illinoinensis]|uniref:Uncharacterized protein n=1 Tax=Carya illinoinensis TaxID=32201 RepID=A0A8T1PJT0_CARIL|nr:hypothetical protein CIPAW_09G189300 [Carya illinoinensis]
MGRGVRVSDFSLQMGRKFQWFQMGKEMVNGDGFSHGRISMAMGCGFRVAIFPLQTQCLMKANQLPASYTQQISISMKRIVSFDMSALVHRGYAICLQEDFS